MKFNVVKKSVLAVAGLCTLFSVNLSAADKKYERAQKELKIMSKIFETALSETRKSKRVFLNSREANATYLARQGMVFSFNFGRNEFVTAGDWAAFGEGVGHLVGEIASEVGHAIADAPVAPAVPEAVVDLEDYFGEYQDRIEAQEAMRERLAEQREQVREIQREIRRVEREKRREEERAASERLKSELERKVEKLDRERAEYDRMMKEYRNKRDEKYMVSSKKKSDAILTTLCDYGATLRSLKNNEYITLIFKNYSGDDDQVYVFEFSDVRNCNSADKLVKQAISYKI
ncbi:MAG: hypothetical protein OQK04_18440 [Kangiellaceae bacterium]|nr:hypothetical protein [Kangiellaceae bacterium]MCW9000696.1 hypothetical protein [Kangiellaceae bacterium]